MEGRVIPTEEWAGFIDDFSRLHEGQQVTVDVLDAEKGARHIVQNAPLMGISIDTRTHPASLEIATGDMEAGLVRHVVDTPATIYLESVQERDIVLQIEPAEGPKTVLLLGGEVQ